MEEKKQAFQLIGLRVVSGCDEKLKKILKPDTTYFFCNNYEDNGNGGVKLKNDICSLDSDFFLLEDNNKGPHVCVSCIVGHNGDGKSSIVELLIRAINNFAYLAGFLSDHSDLQFIPELYVDVFYTIDDDICCISCRGNVVKLFVNNEETFSREYATGKKKEERKTKRILIEQNAHYLFYTLVSNYSLYAYNSEEFKSETKVPYSEDSWISALFHKNDAYQTPVAISPQRVRGVIDINKEYKLSLQRLCELFFNCKNGNYRISNTERAEGIVYSLESSSKLMTHTIKDYLLDENRGAKNVLVFDGDFSVSKKKRRFILNINKKDEFDLSCQFWDNFDKNFYSTNLLPFSRSLFEIDGESKSNEKGKPVTDLYQYLTKLKNKLLRRKKTSALDNIDEFLANGGGDLTFMQFQRLFLVFEVYKKWLAELLTEEFRPLTTKSATVRDHAVKYLVYKTIKALEYYPDYLHGGVREYEIPHFFFSVNVRTHLVCKWFDALKADIIDHKTHLTLKIRQTLNYLKNKDISSAFMTNKSIPHEVKSVLDVTGHRYYLSCKDYYELIKNASEFAGSLPPPFFVYDFVISRDGISFYPLSRMSSGERQLLNSASSVVYHINNISNSKPQGTKITYRNVNVILEEVELYFHPEYQRRFIKYLLDQISNVHLSDSLFINLLIVTHSPFVLSDIPRQNVLFLNNGKPDRSMQEDTFGANIHTLLQNGFFLDSVPIGAFAKEKISNLFKLLNKSEMLSEREMAILEREIPLVSEPLLRGQLMRIYSQRKNFNNDYINRISELESKIKYLEILLNDNNRLEKH